MKIPDDIFDTRCRYCVHGFPEHGNNEIEDSQLLSHSIHDITPCNILSLVHGFDIPGECIHFNPTHQFGICLTCVHNNVFAKGYCLMPEQKNKHLVYVGNSFAGASANPEYWSQHVLSVCDYYSPSPTWISIIRENATKGRAPKNFDPDTMMPISTATVNHAAERWAQIQKQEDAKRKAAEQAAEEKAKKAELEARRAEEVQFSLFEE